MPQPTEYEMLHYHGDVTRSPSAQSGGLLGINEIGWPWMVIDAEYDREQDRTTVHVETASPDAVRDAVVRARMGS